MPTFICGLALIHLPMAKGEVRLSRMADLSWPSAIMLTAVVVGLISIVRAFGIIHFAVSPYIGLSSEAKTRVDEAIRDAQVPQDLLDRQVTDERARGIVLSRKGWWGQIVVVVLVVLLMSHLWSAAMVLAGGAILIWSGRPRVNAVQAARYLEASERSVRG